MKSARNILIIFLAFILVASCTKQADKPEDPKDAKEILEKTFEKYMDLIKKDGKGIKSLEARMSIKGGAQLPMGDSGGMPLDIDANVDIYAAKPQNLYLEISGNLGNASLVVSGKEKPTATLMLPSTKQFATMDVPDQFMQEIQKAQEETPQEPDKMEEFWKQVILEYEGTQKVTAGKAHKIIIKPKDPAEKGSITAYILDGKWDPVRLEYSEEGESKLSLDFEKLEVNANIPEKRFVPNTEGYTQVSQQQITTTIIMQIMSSMMQKSVEE